MTKENNNVSSHIFMFPFSWDCVNDNQRLDSCIEKRINVSEFVKKLDEDKWKKKEFSINQDIEYNKYTYFYDNVCDAIYGKKKCKKIDRKRTIKGLKNKYFFNFQSESNRNMEIVYNYEYIGQYSYYKIKVANGKTYKLKICKINLKIYDTGIAVLTYMLDNEKKEQCGCEDILKINDYGRRIYPQYIPIDKVKESFLADELSIELECENKESYNYDIYNNYNYISKTVLALLGKKFKFKKESLTKGDIYIKPIIDDRMFVMSIYNTDYKNNIWIEPKKLKKSFWYKYIFVDNNDVTCQDEVMLENLLSKATYSRWKKYGTFFGISRYSFVMLTEGEDNRFLVDHFKTMYYEMVLLALVQRASILRFLDEISKISELDDSEALEKTSKLQKRYLYFLSKLSFREVTAQEQGIELYDKLLENMRIAEDVARLDKSINELNKCAAFINSEKTNSLLNIVAALGTGSSFLALVLAMEKMTSWDKITYIHIYGVVFIGLIYVISTILQNRKLKKIALIAVCTNTIILVILGYIN